MAAIILERSKYPKSCRSCKNRPVEKMSHMDTRKMVRNIPPDVPLQLHSDKLAAWVCMTEEL
jgi:hypothetical protein